MTQGALDFSGSSEGGPRAPAGPPGTSPTERVLIAPGPRAAEALLLREIARACGEARANPRLLALPVRVIVPSRSLREHIAAKLVEAEGGLAGLVVQTLRGLCHELLRGHQRPLRSGDTLMPILVRRAAALEPLLAEALAPLEDGFAVVDASVRDLLDAGLTEANADAALEALASGPDPRAGERAQAVVRVALFVLRELGARGFSSRAALFARAAECVGAGALRAREVWIHGYADVTGVQLDVLEALVRTADARLVLDQPPDPTALGGETLGLAFTERLKARLGASGRLACEPAPTTKLTLLSASGSGAEVRAVAEQIRAVLDEGVAPESIAIVARDLTPYRFALSTHLRRLAIPFSGGAGFLDGGGRRVQALLAWIEHGARTPADRWLEARAPRRDGDDLRVAFHGIGAGRLADVARLDLALLLEGADEYVLPVRRALATVSEADAGAGSGEDDADPEEAERELLRSAPGERLRASRRKVPRALLAAACAAAQRALDAHAELTAPQPIGTALERLAQFAERELGWRHETPGRSELARACAGLAQDLPEQFALDGAELRMLLRRALRSAGVAPLGGSGGGVRVLSVTEARACSFARLYLIGANRDVFPRSFSEDVLLSDALRVRLEAAFSDIPIKRRAVDEERYLFAQLMNAAPEAQISWQGVSDDGKERPVSPLVARIEAPGLAIAKAGPSWEGSGASPRRAHEHAVAFALAGAQEAAEGAAQIALGEGAARVASARRAARRELDAAPQSARLGPFFGFVGERVDTRGLSVSRLEGAVRCGWQVFLEHVLGLEPPVDALAALPEITGLLLGNTVHGALEEIALSAGVLSGISLAEARLRTPLPVPWPDAKAADELLLRVARRVAREEGVVLPGFAQLLARRARETFALVELADWPSGPRSRVVGVEVTGERLAKGGDGGIPVAFRADRVDSEDAGIALTDYKTGKPFTRAADPDKREEALRKRVAAGVLLQGAAYALAVGARGRGRYVYARPGLAPDRAEVSTRADAALQASFDTAVEQIVRAWRAGAFVPRLARHDGPAEAPACKNCRVAEACLRGDTSARHRLVAWRERGAQPGEPASVAAARALLALGKPER